MSQELVRDDYDFGWLRFLLAIRVLVFIIVKVEAAEILVEVGRFWHVASVGEGFLLAEELLRLAGCERGCLIVLCENEEVSFLLLIFLRLIWRGSSTVRAGPYHLLLAFTLAGGLRLTSGLGWIMESGNLMGVRGKSMQHAVVLGLLSAGKLPWRSGTSHVCLVLRHLQKACLLRLKKNGTSLDRRKPFLLLAKHYVRFRQLDVLVVDHHRRRLLHGTQAHKLIGDELALSRGLIAQVGLVPLC